MAVPSEKVTLVSITEEELTMMQNRLSHRSHKRLELKESYQSLPESLKHVELRTVPRLVRRRKVGKSGFNAIQNVARASAPSVLHPRLHLAAKSAAYSVVTFRKVTPQLTSRVRSQYVKP